MNKKRKWWWLLSYRIKTVTNVKIRVKSQNVQLNLKQRGSELLHESTYTCLFVFFKSPIANSTVLQSIDMEKTMM